MVLDGEDGELGGVAGPVTKVAGGGLHGVVAAAVAGTVVREAPLLHPVGQEIGRAHV